MRKRYPIPILLLLVFSMSGVIVFSVFSCTVSVPGGDAVVCLRTYLFSAFDLVARRCQRH